ncbi:thioredoxin-like protein 2 [Babesia caballi]|uniref:Thioredoxin-like protein 2 n=1 Tax=Babesia caballi TaxID=5871 RepID=A0AAV4LVZ8_BABCB|nr:thioredoxin-like protein 2 [Babesia caballi]
MSDMGDSSVQAVVARHPGKLVLYLEDRQYPGHAQLCTVIESLKQDFPDIAFDSIGYAAAKGALGVDGSPCFVFFEVQVPFRDTDAVSGWEGGKQAPGVLHFHAGDHRAGVEQSAVAGDHPRAHQAADSGAPRASLHEGRQARALLPLQPRSGEHAQRGGRGLRGLQHLRGPRAPGGAEGLLQLAHLPAALRQGTCAVEVRRLFVRRGEGKAIGDGVAARAPVHDEGVLGIAEVLQPVGYVVEEFEKVGPQVFFFRLVGQLHCAGEEPPSSVEHAQVHHAVQVARQPHVKGAVKYHAVRVNEHLDDVEKVEGCNETRRGEPPHGD